METIKANELRIGNLLFNDGVVVTIDARSIFDIWDDKGLNNYSPIPLTEEWLMRFGFEENEEGYWVIVGQFYDMRKILKTSLYQGDLQSTKYVHQLQNLYFAITGEELTIKQYGNN